MCVVTCQACGCVFIVCLLFGFVSFFFFFFFNDTATTEIYTRSIVGSVRCVQETVIFVFLIYFFFWRESNPRPNEETICFLHAYLCLNFRIYSRPEPLLYTLSSLVSLPVQGDCQLFPIYCTTKPKSFGTTAFE
eukprot:TRINITY_DN1585_c0_g1_i1.p2 TRINITY_DN1585_c0_g1~~TRINITY_DN1585_c0_g1_i1.p2  ORF type:complete len:134 (+),score=10.36 TRINITY_DN1585_c0_g1_i1:3-404(+)